MKRFLKRSVTTLNLPWLVITDSRARLMGQLGHYRNMEFVRDVVVLVSKATPKEYIEYLEKNAYEYYISGDDRCDMSEALDQLNLYRRIEHVRVDAVGSLATSLLNEGLADELCVILAPYLLQSPSLRAFAGLKKDVRLFPVSSQPLRNGYFITMYKIEK